MSAFEPFRFKSGLDVASYPVERNCCLYLSSRSSSRSRWNVDAVHDPEAITTKHALIEDPSASVTPDVLPPPSGGRIRPVTALPPMTFPPNAITRDMSISMPRVAKAHPDSRLT